MPGVSTLLPGIDAFDVLDAMSCLTVIVDIGTGLVTATNSATSDITGFQRDELVGRPLTATLMAPPCFEQAQALLQESASESLVTHVEAPLLTKSGGQLQFLWSAKRIQTSPGSTAHALVSGHEETVGPTRAWREGHVYAGAGSLCVVTDAAGRVTLWTDEAEQLVGYSRSEMVGRTLPLSLFDADQLRSRATALGIDPDLRVLTLDPAKIERRSGMKVDLGQLDRRSRTTSGHLDIPSEGPANEGATRWTLIHKDGSPLTVAVTIRTIENSLGEQIGFLGGGMDVTAQQRTHDLLVSALARESIAGRRLKELDEAKDNLIATVSHELRTPLTSIDGYTELLEDGLGGELTPQQRVQVDAIRRNTDRLAQLVEDMLTLSGIEAGTVRSEQKNLDLRDPVRRAWTELGLDTAKHGLATRLDLPPHPVVVRGEVTNLLRAVKSLLSNAVKCTEVGDTVSCVLLRTEDTATLKVADTGFGIPADEQSSVFARFFRTSTAQAREVQGSGLGLAIAAAAVHGCGGNISVESEHGVGSVFTVELPLASDTARVVDAVS